MARLLFILAEWPRRYAPLMPNQVVDLLHRAWREVTSCLAHEPNSNDREYSPPFPHIQSNRVAEPLVVRQLKFTRVKGASTVMKSFEPPTFAPDSTCPPTLHRAQFH
jgi:hypothetical protein